MRTRSLLISYAGYPFTPSSLMPDNGLANLAGALIESGHDTVILDYGTVDMARKLYPDYLSRKAIPIYQKLLNEGSRKRKVHLKDLISLRALSRKLRRYQNQAVMEIAAEIIQKIEKFKPDFIGFKLWNGDGFYGSIRLAEMIKKNYPSLKIFGGGPQVDIFREQIYSATDVFNALVYAEGEEVLPRLGLYCRGKLSLSEIPNLIYKRGSRIRVNEIKWIDELDQLPFPVYDDEIYPAMRGDQKLKIIVIDESRGCPYRCAFCIQPIKSGTKLRLKSHRRIIDEIQRIIRSYHVTAFRYAGSSTPLTHAVKIADIILSENLKITYSSFGHIGKTSDSEFAILKKSGCYSIFFGIESGSREILRRGFGKKIEPELIRKVIASSRKAGIFTVGSVIFPGPFETKKTEKESLDLLLEVRPDSVPIQFPGIYPGTEWRLHPEKYNFKFTCPDYEKVAMNYKIKLLYPPAHWDPLPYRVNEMNFKQFTRKTADFSRKLESAGILTHISDDQALMALHAGYQGKEKEFRDRLRFSFLSGEVSFIEELVRKINRSVEGNI